MDDFELLGLGANASADAVRDAHRKLVRAHHPDIAEDPASAQERLKEINAAVDRIRAGKPQVAPKASPAAGDRPKHDAATARPPRASHTAREKPSEDAPRRRPSPYATARADLGAPMTLRPAPHQRGACIDRVHQEARAGRGGPDGDIRIAERIEIVGRDITVHVPGAPVRRGTCIVMPNIDLSNLRAPRFRDSVHAFSMDAGQHDAPRMSGNATRAFGGHVRVRVVAGDTEPSTDRSWAAGSRRSGFGRSPGQAHSRTPRDRSAHRPTSRDAR